MCFQRCKAYPDRAEKFSNPVRSVRPHLRTHLTSAELGWEKSVKGLKKLGLAPKVLQNLLGLCVRELFSRFSTVGEGGTFEDRPFSSC